MMRFMATWIVSVALIFSHDIVVAQTNSNPTGSVYDTTGSNLTDQERVTSETYIHEGISQETKDAACNESKEMKDACAGRETHAWANWVPLIIKAYGMVVGMMPGEYSVEKTSSS